MWRPCLSVPGDLKPLPHYGLEDAPLSHTLFRIHPLLHWWEPIGCDRALPPVSPILLIGVKDLQKLQVTRMPCASDEGRSWLPWQIT